MESGDQETGQAIADKKSTNINAMSVLNLNPLIGKTGIKEQCFVVQKSYNKCKKGGTNWRC